MKCVVFLFFLSLVSVCNSQTKNQDDLPDIGPISSVVVESLIKGNVAPIDSMLVTTEMLYELYKEANSIPISDSVESNRQFDIIDQLNTRSTSIVKNISERLKKDQIDLRGAIFEAFTPIRSTFPEDLNMDMAYGVHGQLTNDTTQHLMFNVIVYHQKVYLIAPFFLLMNDEQYFGARIRSANSVSSDEQGMLTISGSMAITNKAASAEEISSCLEDNMLIGGKEKVDVQLIKGQWALRFPIFSVVSGDLNYQYEYAISDGFVHYNFYDFRNPEPESDFKSLSQIPLKPNEAILAVLDQKKYERLINTTKQTLIKMLAKQQILIEGCLKE